MSRGSQLAASTREDTILNEDKLIMSNRTDLLLVYAGIEYQIIVCAGQNRTENPRKTTFIREWNIQ